MDLQALNQQALIKHKPIRKIKELTLNAPYKILSAKTVKGKFGKVVLLELEEYAVFLPNRMTEVFKGKESLFLNERYSIVYKGEKSVGAFVSSQFEIIEI